MSFINFKLRPAKTQERPSATVLTDFDHVWNEFADAPPCSSSVWIWASLPCCEWIPHRLCSSMVICLDITTFFGWARSACVCLERTQSHAAVVARPAAGKTPDLLYGGYVCRVIVGSDIYPRIDLLGGSKQARWGHTALPFLWTECHSKWILPPIRAHGKQRKNDQNLPEPVIEPMRKYTGKLEKPA